jgi:hypothetical protein
MRLLDVDDTVIEVHGHAKQGAGFGYSRLRGRNTLLATLTTPATAPVIVAQRLRKCSCNSSRGARRLVGDAVATARRLLGPDRAVLLRLDSAYYGRRVIGAALAGGAAVLHLPQGWPWQTAWTQLFDRVSDPPAALAS